MAFDTAVNRIRAVERAGRALGMFKTIYFQANDLRSALALYQDGTDPVFNAAFNTLFTNAERAELALMIGQLDTLLTDWAANHAWVTTGF